MVPFYIFYSMFGFQRTGDQMWAFGDARGRGFLMGATAGRTTLMGEGLQHDDGHSQVHASTVPNVQAYDPAYAYELAAIVRDGIERMFVKRPDGSRGDPDGSPGEDVYYYISLYNENYTMPKKPDGVDEGIIRGIYRLFGPPEGRFEHRARLVGSGSILQQIVAAQQLLAEKFGVGAEVYSAPSFGQLRRDALSVERWNRLHPDAEPRVPYVSKILGPDGGPIVAATDWVRTLPDMVARWVPEPYVTLGTDGFGRSDTRESLRAFFEIDPPSIAAATLSALARCGAMPGRKAARAIKELGVDPERAAPFAV
jgi:pyruvate dehydrogenase E1 component